MPDLNNSLENATRETSATPATDSTQSGNYSQEPPALTTECVGTESKMREKPFADSSQSADKAEKKKRDKPLKIFGAVCITIFIAAMILYPSNTLDTSGAAKAALKDKISTMLAAGAILMSDDENIGEQDYTLTHAPTNQNDTRIWIWDYAAEDGDYVQVLLNGVPDGPPFMIKHKPVLRHVSLNGLVGQVQVKGVRDGGGGITYAVRFEINNTTYFNSAPEGSLNTYTLENAAN
jgi:hypothetical protein